MCFLCEFLQYTQYIIRYLFSSTAMCHYSLLMTIYDMWMSETSIGVGIAVFVIAWEKVWVQSFMLFLSLFCRHRCEGLWVCRCFVNHVSSFGSWLTVKPLCQSNHKLWGFILITMSRKPFWTNSKLLYGECPTHSAVLCFFVPFDCDSTKTAQRISQKC